MTFSLINLARVNNSSMKVQSSIQRILSTLVDMTLGIKLNISRLKTLNLQYSNIANLFKRASTAKS